MISHSGGWPPFAIILVIGALIVLARAFAPLIRSLGLLIGLIGAAMGVLAAAVALCAVIFAGVAGWLGWNQTAGPSALSGHPGPLRFALAALAISLGLALIIAAFARGRWRRKQE